MNDEGFDQIDGVAMGSPLGMKNNAWIIIRVSKPDVYDMFIIYFASFKRNMMHYYFLIISINSTVIFYLHAKKKLMENYVFWMC